MDSIGNITLYNADCMDIMRQLPDKAFDLAIVDPPYGLNYESSNGRGKLKNRCFNKGHISAWDVAPKKEYFEQLRRVSQRQIIWGGNYFGLPPCRCFICWDKIQPWKNFSQVEYAWTSFEKPAALFRFDNRTGYKIHPTQKPVALYKWLLANYAKPGDKILDTHLGSGSICIACHDMGFEMTGIELDKDYYEAAKKRLLDHQSQQKFF